MMLSRQRYGGGNIQMKYHVERDMSTRRGRQVVCGVLFLALLHLRPCTSASAFGFQDAAARKDALLTLAENTVHAIREKDMAFISANIDEKGVSVGIDSDRMSAAEFRRQLAKKAGVYCVIFDPTCLPHGDGSSAKSLRDLVLGKEVSIDLHEVKDEPKVQTVDVRSHASSDVLFTLIYRYTGKVWKLQQVEYD